MSRKPRPHTPLYKLYRGSSAPKTQGSAPQDAKSLKTPISSVLQSAGLSQPPTKIEVSVLTVLPRRSGKSPSNETSIPNKSNNPVFRRRAQSILLSLNLLRSWMWSTLRNLISLRGSSVSRVHSLELEARALPRICQDGPGSLNCFDDRLVPR
jgi:hypothetical protein